MWAAGSANQGSEADALSHYRAFQLCEDPEAVYRSEMEELNKEEEKDKEIEADGDDSQP